MYNFQDIKIYASTSWTFSETVPEATESDMLYLCLRSADGTVSKKYSSIATALPTGYSYSFAISKNDTDMLPGYYSWQLLLSGEKEVILYASIVEVLINCDGASTVQEFWMQQVQAIRATIAKLNVMTTTEVTFAGRTYKYKDMRSLTQLLSYAEKMAGIRKRTPRILGRY